MQKIKKINNIVEIDTDNTEFNREKFNTFFGISNNDKAFLSYGRPGKTKGIFVYLDAIKSVVNELSEEQLKNVKFCFIMANDPLVQKQKFLKQIKVLPAFRQHPAYPPGSLRSG